MPIHLAKQEQAEPCYVSEAIKNKTGKGREILRERGKEFPHCTLEVLHEESI